MSVHAQCWRYFRTLFPRVGAVEIALLFGGCFMLFWWLLMATLVTAFLAKGGL